MASQSVLIFYIIVYVRKLLPLSAQKIVGISTRTYYKNIENLRTSQGYIFYTLQIEIFQPILKFY